MSKRKRPQTNKWQLVCDNCYRKQYCQFVLTTDSCLLFRPKEAEDTRRLKWWIQQY